ncbi:MAG: hypothetical protein PF588_01105 [Candidatus Kapabacteria bacterium]|jgi:hypothetical protein|nr:hypothetical protein [Candidatus Kapabacteria bacterium]
MKKFFALAISLTLIFGLFSCSEDSDPAGPSYDDYALNGTWDVIVTFTDSSGDQEPVVSYPSINVFSIEGNTLLTWTLMEGEREEQTMGWVFSADGDNFEFHNDILPTNNYSGKMNSDNSFTIEWGEFAIEMLEYSLPGYDAAVAVGTRR